MSRSPTEFTDYSDQELKAELKRREEERKQQRWSKQQEEADFWLTHVDSLLALIPEHCRTSCGDTHITNEHRCKRCFLLYAQMTGNWDHERELTISINRR